MRLPVKVLFAVLPLAVAVSTPAHAASYSSEVSAYVSANLNKAVVKSSSGYPVLKLGSSSPYVDELLRLLLDEGYALGGDSVYASYADSDESEDPDSATPFDEQVEALVKSFQEDRGLVVDGVVGRGVWGALGIAPSQLQSSVQASPLGANEARAVTVWAGYVDLWSKQARAQGYDKLVVVNIPTFTLHAVDLKTGNRDLSSRVIVGTPRTKTPQMFSRIVDLKFNPDWTPTSSMPGKRYMKPGPSNPLGEVRFSMDNGRSIYLHDTNSRGLFSSKVRAFSHGCVRVQEWRGLAAWIGNMSASEVDANVKGNTTHFKKVKPVAVVLAYSLVDLTPDGFIRAGDIYGMGQGAIGRASLNGFAEPVRQDRVQIR